MKAAAACIAWNRPDYLKETLESFSKNDLSDYSEIFFGIETGNNNEKVIEVANSVDFLKPRVHVNPVKLAMKGNSAAVINRVFDAGYDYCFYMEDDVLISPDATRLCKWFWDQDLKEYIAITMYCSSKRNDLNPEGVKKKASFHVMSFGVSKRCWKEYVEPQWFTVGKTPSSAVNLFCGANPPLKVCGPELARCYHIGRFGGVHYRADRHDKLYMDISWNKSDEIFKYNFVG